MTDLYQLDRSHMVGSGKEYDALSRYVTEDDTFPVPHALIGFSFWGGSFGKIDIKSSASNSTPSSYVWSVREL